MWKERIQALGVESTFRPSAIASELEETEMALGVALPTEFSEKYEYWMLTGGPDKMVIARPGDSWSEF